VNRYSSQFVAVVALFVALASPAAAQRAAGPNSGVLGTTDETNVRETLTVRGSFFGAWDDIANETTSETTSPDVDRRFLRSGFAGGANGRLSHARRTTRTQWLTSGDTALRVYGGNSEDIAATFAGRSSINSDLNSRLTLSASGGWSYSPYYELSPAYGSQFENIGSFGGGFGLATAAERNTSADGRASMTVRLSRRDTIEVDANGRRWDFLDQSESSVTFYGAHGRFRHSLTRSLGVYAGFGREEAKYDLDSRSADSNTIDVGLDFGDTLEFTRRTALSFGFSTSGVRWEEETHWRVNGSATLTRAFGRSGSGLLQYRRQTEYTGGFREPLLTDTFSGGFSDQIGRDASWSINLGYVRGEIGFDEFTSRRFDIYDVGGRVTRALTRNLGVFGDYTYYRYEVPSEATVFTFLPKFSRQSLSFGLTLWAPLVNDTRPPREAR
jgi:hypothetical protein